MLTRLLYPVEHVRLNIEYCILNNHKNELSYWLAEYYYSGFQNECMDWIIQIYYTYLLFNVTISSAVDGCTPIVLSKSLFFNPLTIATEKP